MDWFSIPLDHHFCGTLVTTKLHFCQIRIGKIEHLDLYWMRYKLIEMKYNWLQMRCNRAQANSTNSEHQPCIISCFNFLYRVAQKEESPRASVEEKVQKEFRFLGLREEDQVLDPENGEEAVVLLVRHHPCLLQHLRGGCWTLQSTKVAHRIFT